MQGVQGEAGVEVLQARLALQAQQDPHVRIYVHREGALLVQKGRLLTSVTVKKMGFTSVSKLRIEKTKELVVFETEIS